MKSIFILILIAAAVGVGYHLGSGGNINDLLYGNFLKKDVPVVVSDTTIERKAIDSSPKLQAGDAAGRLPGTWKSSADASFTREFRADATVIDRYAGNESATMQGEWAVFSSPTDEPVPFEIQPGIIYLKITFVEEVLYYSVSGITKDSLELTYLDRGGTLRFTKMR